MKGFMLLVVTKHESLGIQPMKGSYHIRFLQGT